MPSTQFYSVSPRSSEHVKSPCLVCTPVTLAEKTYHFALHATSAEDHADLAISIYETGQRMGFLRDSDGRNLSVASASRYTPAELSRMVHGTLLRLHTRIGPGLCKVLDQSLQNAPRINRRKPVLTYPHTQEASA